MQCNAVLHYNMSVILFYPEMAILLYKNHTLLKTVYSHHTLLKITYSHHNIIVR